jgi:hypothetical protein
MTDKERYSVLCANESSIPIYTRDWWLDCVCGKDKWNVILCLNGDEIEAAMPFYQPRKGVITMPPYTQVMGIWFNPALESEGYSKNIYRKQVLCDELIGRLPSHRSFLQNFHYTFTDWLPFYWKGYRQTTRYDYVLPDIRKEEGLWKGLNDNTKRNIQKAKEKYKLEIRKNIPVDQFIEINEKSFQRQGEKIYCPRELKKLIETARLRNQGDCWGAFDEQERLHAAVFFVWQENCAYCLAGGGDPELRQSGAHAFVMWEAIREVSRFSASFDFEGSMIRGVEQFFRGFGAIQKPYYTLSKGKISLLEKVFHKIFSK